MRRQANQKCCTSSLKLNTECFESTSSVCYRYTEIIYKTTFAFNRSVLPLLRDWICKACIFQCIVEMYLLWVWSSCFGQEGKNKKHENDKNCKTHPKADHNGICRRKQIYSNIYYSTHIFLTHSTQFYASICLSACLSLTFFLYLSACLCKFCYYTVCT